MLLEMNNVKKIYGKGLNTNIALNHMNLSVQQGEFVAIMGESGSGKSTLLNLIASYDNLTEGDIIVDDIYLSKLKSKDIARYRQRKIGFIFQEFNLLPNMTNKENIIMPLILANQSYKSIIQNLEYLSNQLHITDILDKYPTEISGGQQQRIAIARALITQPMLLLADEPTGALDSQTSKTVMGLLQHINGDGQTILMVTHSNIDASYARRVIFIKDGRLFHEIYRGDETQMTFRQKIADSLALINGRSD
ncbi:ABC transporter ATP-binding protein [Staphylococcus simiae]|uniref:Putative hemin import ATP-binding protein HrtA n=1 Tax=Staphylococcus simiae CCM 7213 = CCUG 51256 TaxID=911238 RepID=G5JLC5_9STAP|nr:ABC transporter ATP-binding protein [Staphylococcus simiae]EHJ07013.1 ABC transporter ATP-binding protein [Staphylococcus simiae CCM 7213 = CCUG 51256]PNZ10069.1 ABC transporter ATP-binding protein [Staphylococcus simiae]SNV84219.1 ABC transporter ATP-binding protein [Staphylococcus simiae]